MPYSHAPRSASRPRSRSLPPSLSPSPDYSSDAYSHDSPSSSPSPQKGTAKQSGTNPVPFSGVPLLPKRIPKTSPPKNSLDINKSPVELTNREVNPDPKFPLLPPKHPELHVPEGTADKFLGLLNTTTGSNKTHAGPTAPSTPTTLQFPADPQYRKPLFGPRKEPIASACAPSRNLQEIKYTPGVFEETPSFG